MRKALLLFIVMISMALFSTAAFAAAWNVPINVRIVQKSNRDINGRIYDNIQAAINNAAASGASATNPFLVQVMPGIYNEIVTMKQYVDIVGSGQENTKITSGSVGSSNNCYAMGTVVMAGDSRLENISVENTNTANCRIAINIGKSNVVIDRVKAQTTGPFGELASSGHGNAAIYAFGEAANIAIKNTTALVTGASSASREEPASIKIWNRVGPGNVYIDNVVAENNITGPLNYCVGIALWSNEQSLHISNSSFKASCNGASFAHGMDIWPGNSIIKISNVNSEAALSPSVNVGAEMGAGNITADGSRFTAGNSASQSFGIKAPSSATIELNNSVVTGGNFGIKRLNSGYGSIKIGGSLIGGPEGYATGFTEGTDKIINCHDQNYNPIPNM